MKFFTIVFAFFLFLIPATAKTAGLFESCSPAVCWGDLQCPGFQTFGQSLKKDKICYPEKTYTPCGASGDCSTSPKDRVCVVGNAVDKTTGAVAFCIKESRFPPGDKGDAIFDKCLTSKNCGKNEQCVRITRYDKELKGLSEFVQNNNCIPLNELPANLIVQDTTGSCGQNQECGADETCVENTYIDIVANKNYIPLAGLLTFKSPVCYKTKYLNGVCTKHGDECALTNGKGLCMHTLDAGKNILKCVDPSYLPNGPKSPSNYECSVDSQCSKSSPEYKYCIENPVTKKGNCFSQATIFTTMSGLPKEECGGKPCVCPLVGKEGCEPSGKESICAKYNLGAVCIDYTGGGAALSNGKGEATPEPSHLPKADVAQQTYEMYAPKLQIDIPNLTFTDKITAEDGPGGIKRFSIPYLAAYIQAIYKYAIGLGVLIAVVMLMYAGFRWMSSFGNTKAVSEAKTMVGNSMLGLLLVFSAYTILYVINPELPKFTALSILAPKQQIFVSLNEEEITEQSESEAGSGPTTAREACLMKTFAPGKKYGDTPETVSIEIFNIGRKVAVNKYSAEAWKKVSKEILASQDPEIKGILQYMYDFRDKKVPDMTGVKDADGVISVLIKCIGCNKQGVLKDDIGYKMHPVGLAVDFMTRSGWAIKWGPKKTGTSYCAAYKKTLDKMKSGEYGEYLKSDPYKMFARLTPLAESCVNEFNNGKWTIWPKKFSDIFTENGFVAGENYKGLYTDAMHFEYFGPCKNVK